MMTTLIYCSSSKKVSVLNVATPLAETDKVEVIGVGEKMDSNYKLLGHIKIGDGGFTTKCSYAQVIKDAQEQARIMGGNVIQIIKHQEPNALTSCHRLTCDVYLKK